MFSNSSRYALEETIKEFNDFLHTKANTVKYTAVDYKNAFYQRFRKNFQRTNDWHTTAYHFGFDNIILGINEGNIDHLDFIITNQYNSKANEFIKDLNEVFKQIDLVKIRNENIVYCGVLEQCNNIVNQINNYKIK